MDRGPFASFTRLAGPRHSRRTVLGAMLGVVLLRQGGGLDDQEAALLGLINAYRAANGVGPLAVQGQLMAAAERHSADEATRGYSDHLGSDGSTDIQRIEQAGYTTWAAEAENLHWNSSSGSANSAFSGWQNSAGHNANMLRDYTDVGIARAQAADGSWYWTAVFARSW
jgi:uncharacterized protein YkwD